MKIENLTEAGNASLTAVKVKVSADDTQQARHYAKRDRAEFDRRAVGYARTLKATVKAQLDTRSETKNAGASALTEEAVPAELNRVKQAAKQAASDDSGFTNKAADMLKEQIKGVSELLADKSNALSAPVEKQLEKIYSLLIDQEKTDPNSISEDLQKEIGKLSEMLSADNGSKGKSLSELLEEQQNKLDGLFSHLPKTDNTLGGIKNKIRQGKKLTPTEQQYLSAKDPTAYESYRKINTARSMFRCSLNNCRTRDDVIGMRLSNALSALASYKKAVRGGGDGGDVIALNAAFENELREFGRSPGYRSLPTAAECNKFDRDLAKAKKYEREKRLQKQREQQRLRCKRYKKKVKKTPGDGKRTVAQVLADPTSKKVLASRAKRTYCACAAVGFSLYKTMNSKA